MATATNFLSLPCIRPQLLRKLGKAVFVKSNDNLNEPIKQYVNQMIKEVFCYSATFNVSSVFADYRVCIERIDDQAIVAKDESLEP